VKKRSVFRQGDVILCRVSALPDGAQLVPGQDKKIVLALGEATGHHHRIEDHISAAAALEIADALIARHQAKARLYADGRGDRYLVVDKPVTLLHEEHTALQIPPGIYEVPIQMEFDSTTMRKVED